MDCYLIKTANYNWVRDLYPQKAIRRVAADLQEESFPGGSRENNGNRERERERKGVREYNMIVLSRVRRTSVLFCLQGLKSVVMIGGR